MSKINDLINYLKTQTRVFIQTHNFPDHDAVATAYGLQYLLKEFGIKTEIIYDGEIQRDSLLWMIEKLDIDISPTNSIDLNENDAIIIVDGCKGNNNVSDLIGNEVAVIDHHLVQKPDNVYYTDIRPKYGACATIIFGYYRELKITIPSDVATALIIAIEIDTDFFKRSTTHADIEAYYLMFEFADINLSNSILRNSINVKDLNFFGFLIDNISIRKRIAICYFHNGCAQNLMGILADFVLSLIEIEFVVIFANNPGKINISMRSETKEWNASKIVIQLLEGIGFGGGHIDMAGGVIIDKSNFDIDKMKNKIYNILI